MSSESEKWKKRFGFSKKHITSYDDVQPFSFDYEKAKASRAARTPGEVAKNDVREMLGSLSLEERYTKYGLSSDDENFLFFGVHDIKKIEERIDRVIEGDIAANPKGNFNNWVFEISWRVHDIVAGKRATMDDIQDDEIALSILESQVRADLISLFEKKSSGSGNKLADEFLRDIKRDVNEIIKQHMGPRKGK